MITITNENTMKRLFLIPTFLCLLFAGGFLPVAAQTAGDNATVQQQPERIMLQLGRPDTASKADSPSIQVMDSATASRWWQRLQQNKQKGKAASAHSFDHEAFMKQLLERRKGPAFAQPPLAVRTQPGQGSQVVVYLENRSQEHMKDITLEVNTLPEGWSSQPQSRTVASLPPGLQAMVTFELAGQGTTAEKVGFTCEPLRGCP